MKVKTKIENNVPIPKGRWYNDILGLKKHESFVFPEVDFNKVRQSIFKIKELHTRKFKTMRISETERRIWRKA